MASYEHRGNAVRVTVRLGKGQRKSETFGTMAEARVWAKTVERAKALGTLKPQVDGGVTVGEMLEVLLRTIEHDRPQIGSLESRSCPIELSS